VFNKLLAELQNYDARDEYTSYVNKLPNTPQAQNMSDAEYERFIKKDSTKNHFRMDKNAKVKIQQGSDNLTIRDQLEITKALEKLLQSYNLPTLKALGTILSQYIQRCVKSNKLFDRDLYIEINDSDILSKALKRELETQQNAIRTKKQTEDPDLILQRNLYNMLFRERYQILGAKMIFGMICKKYLDNANMRMTLIDNYLLYQIGDFAFSGLTDDEIDDEY
jgi:hypothetical protein